MAETEKIDLDVLLYRYSCIQRELDYHRSVLAAAEEGLDKVVSEYVQPRGSDQPGDEELAHIASWAHRVRMATSSVMEVMGGLQHTAAVILELTKPVPPEQSQN